MTSTDNEMTLIHATIVENLKKTCRYFKPILSLDTSLPFKKPLVLVHCSPHVEGHDRRLKSDRRFSPEISRE